MDEHAFEQYLHELISQRPLTEQQKEDRAFEEMDRKWCKAQDVAEELRYMPVQKVEFRHEYINPPAPKLTEDQKTKLNNLKVSVNGVKVDNTYLHTMPFFQTLLAGSFKETSQGAIDIQIPLVKKNPGVVKTYFEWVATVAKNRNVEAAYRKVYDPEIIHVASHFGDLTFLGPSVIVQPSANEVLISLQDGKTVRFRFRPGLYNEDELLRMMTTEIQKTIPTCTLSVEGAEYVATYVAQYPPRSRMPIIKDINFFGNGTKRLTYHMPSYDTALLGKIENYPPDYMELLLNEYIESCFCMRHWRLSLAYFVEKRNIADFLWNSNKEDLLKFYDVPSNEQSKIAAMTFAQLETYAKSNRNNDIIPAGMVAKDASRAIQLLDLIRKRQQENRGRVRGMVGFRRRRHVGASEMVRQEAILYIINSEDHELSQWMGEYKRLMRIPV